VESKSILPLALVSIILLSTVAGTWFTNLVEANFFPEKPPHAIYIKGNGSLEPATASIKRVGNIYTFTGDIINQPIVVERDNIVLDGASFTLQGNGSHAGIDMSYRVNVTVSNIYIKSFFHGVFSYNSNNNTISENTITGNIESGISLLGARDCVISDNLVENNGDGIKCVGVQFGDSCYVTDNIVRYNSGVGIYTYTDNILSDNVVENNGVDFSLIEPESTLQPELTPTPSTTPTISPSAKSSNTEPIPTGLVIVPIATVAVIGAVVAIYFKKRKH
jgi:parallel beta-helix repeat protein